MEKLKFICRHCGYQNSAEIPKGFKFVPIINSPLRWSKKPYISYEKGKEGMALLCKKCQSIF